MPVHLTDQAITELLRIRKPVGEDFYRRLKTRSKRGHSESELQLPSVQGHEFRIIARRADLNPLDFSIVLAYVLPGTSTAFRLRRHNGKSHEHTNQIEVETFYDFHVHMATERYQLSGLREDAYATPTSRYADFDGALDCFVEDCGLALPEARQGRLFGRTEPT